MAWNEPGGNNKDPWGNKNDKGPPDLDEIFKNVQGKVTSIFGRRGGGSGSGGSGPSLGAGGAAVIILVLMVLTAFTAMFTLQEPERGVVTRFGQFVRTAGPGLNFKLPWFIERVETVNVDQNRPYRLPQASMLTQDENIVEIDIAVQYNVKSAEEFVFNMRNPESSVRQVMESAIREVVGKNDMDFILKGRSGHYRTRNHRQTTKRAGRLQSWRKHHHR